MVVLYTNLSFMEYQVSYFGLISCFFSKRWVQVVLDEKSLQEYLVNAEVPQGSIPSPPFLVSELGSDLWDTLHWGSKWLVDFSAGKTELVLFDRFNDFGVIYVKTNGSLLRKNHLLRCWGCLSLLNWIGAPTLPLSLKLLPRKLEPWLVVWSFFLLRLLCISVNLPYDLVWNTVVILGMVLVAASWNC